MVVGVSYKKREAILGFKMKETLDPIVWKTMDKNVGIY